MIKLFLLNIDSSWLKDNPINKIKSVIIDIIIFNLFNSLVSIRYFLSRWRNNKSSLKVSCILHHQRKNYIYLYSWYTYFVVKLKILHYFLIKMNLMYGLKYIIN